MKLPGGLEIGPFMPKTASWICRPGRASRAMTTRLGALNPFTIGPPACPRTSGSFPSTQISA